jgi:hypothetical protein
MKGKLLIVVLTLSLVVNASAIATIGYMERISYDDQRTMLIYRKSLGLAAQCYSLCDIDRR